MNNKYIEDFNSALNIYENNYSHSDLIEFLKSGTVAEKQASAIKLDSLLSESDAQTVMQNLVGCDGKIRESISFRLPEFISKNPEYFDKFEDIFLEAIIDINGNICRNTILALKSLKDNNRFCKNFCDKLTKKTINLANIAKTFNEQDGKYKVNKEIFKLYWYLETIYHFSEYIPHDIILNIISITKNISDYTIREKTAKILSKFDKNDILSKFKEELKQDKNYYVRRV